MSEPVIEELHRSLAAAEGRGQWRRRALIFVAVAILIGGGLLYRVTHRPPPAEKFVTATVAVGNVVEKVQATGTVQPLLQVNIGAQVSGRVVAIHVDFNSSVKKGDVLAEIDPTVYNAQVKQQTANLAAQRANLQSVRASAMTAGINFNRVRKLFGQGLASQSDFDTIRGNNEIAEANVRSSLATIQAIEAQLAQTTANVVFTKIVSPVDGFVISRAIDLGATVVASFQTPTLFVIAQHLLKMRVLADIDEADVGKVAKGMSADAVVDAFPNDVFEGTLSQIRFSPNTVLGVVTYSAVIDVDNREQKLRPGMTSTITVHTRHADGVSMIPNAALRYHPSPPRGPDGKPTPQPTAPPLGKGMARVYVLTADANGFEHEEVREVAIGVTDGINTALVENALPIGTRVVVDEIDLHDKKSGKLF